MIKRKPKKILIIGLISFFVIVSVAFCLLFLPLHNQTGTQPIVEESNKKPPETIEQANERHRLEKQHQDNYQINSNYIGRLVFESGLIDLPIVKSKDNNKDYLNIDFYGNSNKEGTSFMDYRNNLADQNLIFYAHYVYYDESKMFSPLHQLKDQKQYKDNANFSLELENEIRIYQVAYVYYYNISDRKTTYWKTNYTDNFDSYFKLVQQQQLYNTEIEMTKKDHFITLQTCVRNREDLRLIVIGKEVSKTLY